MIIGDTFVLFRRYGGLPVPTFPLFAAVVLLSIFCALPISAEEFSFASEPATDPVTHHYDRFGVEQPSRGAQASFIAGQALHGALLGLQLTTLDDFRNTTSRMNSAGNIVWDTRLQMANFYGVTAGATVGALAGLGTATFLTRNFDAPQASSSTSSTSLRVAPADQDGGFITSIGGSF